MNTPDCEMEAKPIDTTEPIPVAFRDSMSKVVTMAILGLVVVAMGVLWAVFAGGGK